MLDDLGDVAWGHLGHAYGEATDVPDLLRALATGDDDALNELYGNIWHQGTVYEATAYAVPFLIELLDAPETDTAGLLGLLSAIAEGSSYAVVHETGGPVEEEISWVRAARTAVAAGAETYARLLTTGTEDERAWAAHVIGVSEAPVPVLDHLRREDSAFVRASLILAAGVPADGLSDPEPFPRLAAALVAARTPGELPETVIARDAPRSIADLSRSPWSLNGADTLMWVVEALGDRWDLQVRLLTAWMEDPDAEVREAAVFAAEHPLQAWRPAAPRLVPPLAGRLSDEDRDVRHRAANHLAAAGRAASAAADALWSLLEREPVRHNTPSVSALTALCGLQDPRAAAFLERRLASGDLDGLQPAIALIGPWAQGCREALLRLAPKAPAGNARIGVLAALGRLGGPADDLVRVLRKQCRDHPHVTTRVLGDLGPAASKALPELRKALDHEEEIVRINAARAVWRITGTTDVILPVLRKSIETGGYGRRHALECLSELGREGAGLTPLLPPVLEDEDDWVSTRAAVALWQATGDAARAIPPLLRNLEPGRRGTEAVRCLADIGPAAHAAVPVLKEGRDSNLRLITYGSAATLVADDESWSDICAAALSRIDPEA